MKNTTAILSLLVVIAVCLGGIFWKLGKIEKQNEKPKEAQELIDQANVDELKRQRVESDIQAILTALKTYEMVGQCVPSTEQGLQALISQPSGYPKPVRWMQALSDIPLDPWGHRYLYRNPATSDSSKYDVFSVGPDGKESIDDIRAN